MTRTFSAASQRANQYPGGGADWFCGFAYSEVQGLGREVGVHRRDPSSIIEVDGTFYVYYTKSTGRYHGRDSHHHPDYKMWPWDYADIWYATSTDGVNWQEQGCAVARGPQGTYDERTVCTPDVFAHDSRFYLVYQAARNPYDGGNETVGMAVADSPHGPWHKTDAPILSPMAAGAWLGKPAGETYNDSLFHGRCHDPMLLHVNGRFHLYYKCGSGQPDPENPALRNKFAGWDTRWGVAMADSAEGPYVHSEYNPVTNSGHETLVWPYNGGVAALIIRDGPEKDTIQFAEDGINFEIKAKINNPPWAGGAFRTPDTNLHPLKGLAWGLCHKDEGSSYWNYILRFDVEPK